MASRPRSETEADRVLIKIAADQGHSVTPRQLRRWRAEGLLPCRSVRGRGRGAGVEGSDPPVSADQLLALCRWHKTYPRSADKIAVSLWYDGWEVPTERIRRAILRGFDRELERGRIDWSREPLNPLEKMSARGLASHHFDPAERVGPDRLIRDAREDLSRAAFGDADSVDASLLSGYFQLEALAETLPDDGKAGFDAATAIRIFNLNDLAQDLRTCSEAELEAVRSHLRLTYDSMLDLSEGAGSSAIDLGELPPVLAEGLSLMRLDSDTRHPEYDAGKLLSAIGSCLVILRNFEPWRLGNPQ